MPRQSNKSGRGGRRRSESDDGIDWIDRLVTVQRVAKVVKGGRRFSFSAIVVVGDGKGNVGSGLGKANEVADAIGKATEVAKKSVIRVPVNKNGTIPHRIIGKQDAGRVLLQPAAPGTGVIAGGGIRAVMECAGITNILSKSLGTSNPHNQVGATMNALRRLEDAGQVALRRGISLSKVFDG